MYPDHMPVFTKQVRTRKDLKEYIHLPAKLHKGHPNWIPPIYMDEWDYYNPKKNKTFAYSDTILFLAYKEEKACGRIMGIINHRYNELNNELLARFCWMECVNDQEVAHALMDAIEKWAKEKGMQKVIGPFGFSDKDPEGFLIEGYEHKVAITTNYNFPYLSGLVEKEDYIKETDCVSYNIKVPDKIPEFYLKIYERALKNKFNIVEFRKRKEIRPYILPVLQLVNETYNDIYGFLQMEVEEMKELAKRYLPLLDPRFIKVITNNENLVLSFIVGIPNMGEGIQKAKGYLFPFGIFRILRALKKSKQLVLFLGSVKEEKRGHGLDVIMGIKMIEAAQKAGMEDIDSHLILEDNFKMRAEVEKMGGIAYKRYRIYQKEIS